MSNHYNLPRLEDTYISKENGWVFLMWRRGFNGEDGWVSRWPFEIEHHDAWKKHDAGTRRYRRLQLLWKFGGKYFFRERLRAAFYA
jgi:hypothetical protein